MRFELIDRILAREPDRVVAVKNVTTAEEYLADHFPGFPVLPGVMMLETMVQAGRLLTEPSDRAHWVLTDVRNVKYGNMVRPGQALVVEVTVRNRTAQRLDLTGVGRVDEQIAVQGRFSLEPLRVDAA